MHVDTAIVDHFLHHDPIETYCHSWLYSAIEPERYLFETPDSQGTADVAMMKDYVNQMVTDFHPNNERVWRAVFPCGPKQLETVSIQLVVGCPAPYEAMVRTDASDHERIIFDLIRMLRYGVDQAKSIITDMLTHETAHSLLHMDYPENQPVTYREKLIYMRFDEGLAHFLAARDDWQNVQNQGRRLYADDAFLKAIRENDPARQGHLLIRACTGSYWEKFACISGLFQWADVYDKFGENGVTRAYRNGWRLFPLPGE
ncbi:MAG: hypothetical protein ABF608_07745 [Sporolactobacillus sp.]